MLMRKPMLWAFSLLVAIALLSGTGIVTSAFGYDTVPTAHACVGGNGGGDC